jgi:hypothetical protein
MKVFIPWSKIWSANQSYWRARLVLHTNTIHLGLYLALRFNTDDLRFHSKSDSVGVPCLPDSTSHLFPNKSNAFLEYKSRTSTRTRVFEQPVVQLPKCQNWIVLHLEKVKGSTTTLSSRAIFHTLVPSIMFGFWQNPKWSFRIGRATPNKLHYVLLDSLQSSILTSNKCTNHPSKTKLGPWQIYCHWYNGSTWKLVVDCSGFFSDERKILYSDFYRIPKSGLLWLERRNARTWESIRFQQRLSL